jgi:molecular chaperone DnaK (HSP70)
VGGDSRLGGDDFDDEIVRWAADKFRAQTGIDLLSDGRREARAALQKLREKAEAAKIELSQADLVTIEVPDCLGHPLELDLTLSEYNALITPLLKRTVEIVHSVLKQSSLEPGDIDRVILVGGSTKNRAVKEIVAREIKAPYTSERVDEAVSHGAAILASNLSMPEDSTRRLPIEVSDVTAHSLGVGMHDDDGEYVFHAIIPRQTSYPCRGGVLGQTAVPYQEAVMIKAYRGEARNVALNIFLGELEMPVEPQPREVPVAALFELDPDGIIHFTAVELSEGCDLGSVVADMDGDTCQIDFDAVDDLVRRRLAKAKTINIKS